MFQVDLMRVAARYLAICATLGLVIVACSTADTAEEPQIAELHFTDVADEVGLDFRHGAFRWGPSADPAAMMGGGLCWIDYDSDGWLDLFLVNSYAEAEWGRWQDEGGLPRSALYRNRRGQFSDVTDDAGVGLEVRGSGCVAADFDLDGSTDLYVTTARGDVLMWNEGDGTFTDGTESAGTDVYGWHTAAAVGDVNGDGWPDIFVAGYVDPNTPNPMGGIAFPNTLLARRDLLYLNEGPGPNGHVTFREVGEEVGLESSGYEYGLGAVFSDLDNDGDLDLFVANDTNPNRLYENVARPNDPLGFRLIDVTDSAQVGDLNSGMGVAVEDYSGDGFFDLIVTNLGDQLHSVYLNESGLEFTEGHDRLGVDDFGVGSTGWGVSWADFDLDGDRDLMIANGFVPINGEEDRQQLTLYRNTGAGLIEISNLAGLGAVGPLHGRGLAAADYDNDGDVDVAVNSIGGPVLLLENAVAGLHWLTVDLGGFYPGAVVVVELDDGTRVRCEVRAGSSWLSSEDPRCHFGLGTGDATAIHVVWPDGTSRTVVTPERDRILQIEREG
ncbi:MAG: CRTAC1 family protein [Acidobacteria bacterium]|nr:CRTAC1 family protein [Acidobacteriota bacterium]